MLSPIGTSFICCHSAVKPANEKGELFDFQKMPELSLKEIMNSPDHKKIRKDFLNDVKNKACATCWNAEQAGSKSYRQSWHEYYEKESPEFLKNCLPDGELIEPKLNFLQISLGNKCNLKCRTCNPSNSIQWIKESEQLGLFQDVQAFHFKNLDWYRRENFKKDLEKQLPYLDRLNFLGGEPLLIDEHYEILDFLILSKRAPHVELQYNTNMTVYSQSLIDLWKNFKKVTLCLSIDAVGAANDYLRHPSKWDIVEKNIISFLEARKQVNLEILFASTFNALNVEHLPELYSWLNNLNYDCYKRPLFTWVDYPPYLNPQVLPRQYKEFVYEKNQNALSKLDLNGNESWKLSTQQLFDNMMVELPKEISADLWQELKTKTKAIDQYRKEDLRKITSLLGDMVYNEL